MREGTVEQTGQPDRRGRETPLPEIMPEPTAWPAVVAFGACLFALGILTSWAVSLVGLVLLLAGIGGWISRMRHE